MSGLSALALGDKILSMVSRPPSKISYLRMISDHFNLAIILSIPGWG